MQCSAEGVPPPPVCLFGGSKGRCALRALRCACAREYVQYVAGRGRPVKRRRTSAGPPPCMHARRQHDATGRSVRSILTAGRIFRDAMWCDVKHQHGFPRKALPGVVIIYVRWLGSGLPALAGFASYWMDGARCTQASRPPARQASHVSSSRRSPMYLSVTGVHVRVCSSRVSSCPGERSIDRRHCPDYRAVIDRDLVQRFLRAR
jgi:hypothetical protein